MSSLWSECLNHLQTKVSATEYSTWLRVLQADEQNGELTLYAHNQFIAKWVAEHYLDEITGLARFLAKDDNLNVRLTIGLKPKEDAAPAQTKNTASDTPAGSGKEGFVTSLNEKQNFENFVQGYSNQLAKAIAEEVARNPGASQHNPFSLYGGTGLGKTHLLHAIGNEIRKNNPRARIKYLSAERFMNERGRAIGNNTIENFKKFYRSLDVLMIDDIQFLAKYAANNASTEFLNTFNALLENGKQVVVVSDCYPQNIENLEPQLKSRLSWGNSAQIDPPELETRTAILIQKAKEQGWALPEDVADFIAQKVRSHVRALESTLNRLLAWARFTHRELTIDAAREALKDIFASHEQMMTIEKIQRAVAEYYNLKLTDLKSKSKMRTITRPRQIAMALAKELTGHSLPEIGREFGGRDHTTVMHACKTITKLRNEESSINDDYTAITRKLSS